jgi:hypothetical protein
LSDSESEDEPDWEEEFLKLGEEERNAIQKEQEEKEFCAEVMRNQRSSDVKARWKASSLRTRGFKEDTIEEYLCKSICCPSPESGHSDDGMVVDAPRRPKTPSAEDSEWGHSSLSDSPKTQKPETPSPAVSL